MKYYIILNQVSNLDVDNHQKAISKCEQDDCLKNCEQCKVSSQQVEALDTYLKCLLKDYAVLSCHQHSESVKEQNTQKEFYHDLTCQKVMPFYLSNYCDKAAYQQCSCSSHTSHKLHQDLHSQESHEDISTLYCLKVFANLSHVYCINHNIVCSSCSQDTIKKIKLQLSFIDNVFFILKTSKNKEELDTIINLALTEINKIKSAYKLTNCFYLENMKEQLTALHAKKIGAKYGNSL